MIITIDMKFQSACWGERGKIIWKATGNKRGKEKGGNDRDVSHS